MSSSQEPQLDVRAAVQRVLEQIVGPFVARTSIGMASKRIGRTPETLSPEDLPALAAALRPALCTMAGAPAADRLVEQIRSLGQEEQN